VYSKEALVFIQFIIHLEPSCLFSTNQCMGNITIWMMASQRGLATARTKISTLVPPGTETKYFRRSAGHPRPEKDRRFFQEVVGEIEGTE
jgi:hypothetical protein